MLVSRKENNRNKKLDEVQATKEILYCKAQFKILFDTNSCSPLISVGSVARVRAGEIKRNVHYK